MKKTMIMVLAVISAGLFMAPVRATAQESEEQAPAQVMTQGQLAQLLVQKLSLYRHLPLNPSDLECAALLMQLGIYPSARVTGEGTGWDLDAPVSTIDFIRVLVRSMDLEGQVQNPDDDNEWVEVLKRANVPTENVIEGVAAVSPVFRALLSFPAFGLTGDPLYKNPVSVSDVQGALDAINLPTPGEGDLPPPPPPEPPKPTPATPT
ncbi:MAG: hypothetical protein U1E27_00030 [Kiritimatiellia bacterium]|nr:hypothetical protein [Kiritimatiellia bacterium]